MTQGNRADAPLSPTNSLSSRTNIVSGSIWSGPGRDCHLQRWLALLGNDGVSAAPDAALMTSAVIAAAATNGFNNAGRNSQQCQSESNKGSNFDGLLLAVAVPPRAAAGFA
jgi:hypothetical protein